MARTMNRINSLNIPNYLKKEIGLSENWQENISPGQKKMVMRIAMKFKKTLKELSKS